MNEIPTPTLVSVYPAPSPTNRGTSSSSTNHFLGSPAITWDLLIFSDEKGTEGPFDIL